MNFLDEVSEGRVGKYNGLTVGSPRFTKTLNNLQRKRYYLVGAQQKTGKTSWVDWTFVISPFLLNPNANIKWFYYSYEIDMVSKLAKWTALFMGIIYNRWVDDNYILSVGDNELSEEDEKLVAQIYKDYITPLMSKITFHEDKQNPTGIFKELMNYAADTGEFKKETYSIRKVDENGKVLTGSNTYEKIVGYTPKDESAYTIAVIDHVGLVPVEKGYTKKQNIDKLSEYLVKLRNLCKFTLIPVSQFNRALSATDRLKFQAEMLQPIVEDFKDSGNMAEDADTIFALFNPYNFKHLKTHLGYKLSDFGLGYRSLHILANRRGIAPASIPYYLHGGSGFMMELPKNPDNISNQNINTILHEYASRNAYEGGESESGSSNSLFSTQGR